MLDAVSKGRYLAVAPGTYHPMAKLNDAKVLQILQTDDPAEILAARFGVVPATIRDVRNGRTWRHVKSEAVIPVAAE